MLFALDNGVNKKAPPTHIVHWRLNLPSKTSSLLFCQGLLLKSANYPSPLFRRFTTLPPPPPKKKERLVFNAPS